MADNAKVKSFVKKMLIKNLLYVGMKSKYPNIVFLDEGTLREIFGDDISYTKEKHMMCVILRQQELNIIYCRILCLMAYRKRYCMHDWI